MARWRGRGRLGYIYVELKDDTTGELVGTFEITNVDTMTVGQVADATDRMRLIGVV